MGRRVQSSERGERRADIPCLRAVTHRQAVRHFNLRNQEVEDHDHDQDRDQDFGTSIELHNLLNLQRIPASNIEHPASSIQHPVS